jgi:hypothetical protein
MIRNGVKTPLEASHQLLPIRTEVTMLEVQTVDEEIAFNPGDEVRVRVTWDMPNTPERIDLSLGWHTMGKGDRDESVSEKIELDDVGQEQSIELRITLPDGPYSFSGQLISLIWSLQAVARPSGETATHEIVVAPGKMEVQLTEVEE